MLNFHFLVFSMSQVPKSLSFRAVTAQEPLFQSYCWVTQQNQCLLFYLIKVESLSKAELYSYQNLDLQLKCEVSLKPLSHSNHTKNMLVILFSFSFRLRNCAFTLIQGRRNIDFPVSLSFTLPSTVSNRPLKVSGHWLLYSVHLKFSNFRQKSSVYAGN